MSESSRAVLVTGASRGLGFAITRRLAAAGYTVWAGVRNTTGADSLRALGAAVRPIVLDVTKPETIDSGIAEICDQSRALYGLVNNAGITARAFFEDFPEQTIRRIFEVNVFGAMNVTRRALPLLRANGGGRIVMMSSIGGRIGSNSVAPYVASKFALEGFSESLSIEVRPFGIFVSIVSPGIVRTDIWDEATRILPEARDCQSLNHTYFWRMERYAEKLLETSTVTPDDVGRRVTEIMGAGKPKLRYIVGWRAALTASLRRHLPGELFERLYFGEIVRRMTSSSANSGRALRDAAHDG